VLANVTPVVCVLGLAGFAGVALNAVTVMLAAIAMGIAVDDSVHLVTHWSGMRRAGSDSMEALAGALAVKGRPILFTTLILMAILLLMGMSSFPPVRAFGWLSAAALGGALGSVLLLLPSLVTRKGVSPKH
jgi:predicted RND superfamily exporter protein